MKTKNPDDYYIYTYHDPLSGDVVYVGKGKGKRMYQHLTHSSNDRLQKTIEARSRDGLEMSPTMICKTTTEEHAFLIEKALIRYYGRADSGNGTLYNNTDGGDGVSNPSDEVRGKQADAMFRRFGTGENLHFKNLQTGEIFEGTSYELSKHIGVKSTQVRKIFSDATVKSVKGWVVADYTGGFNAYMHQYEFVNVFEGDIFVGTQKEFGEARGLSFSLISQLVKGKQAHANGWVLRGNEERIKKTIRRTRSGKVYTIRRPWEMPSFTENAKEAYLLAGKIEECWKKAGCPSNLSVRKILRDLGVDFHGKLHNYERIYSKIKSGAFIPSCDPDWADFVDKCS